MGIHRWEWGSHNMSEQMEDGDYVLFTDHERVVANLRAELAAKSKQCDALRDGLEAVYHYGSDTLRGPTGETLDDRAWQRQAVLEMTNRASRTIDSGSWKGEGNVLYQDQ